MSLVTLPERLGPYQIVRRLAAGGMAEVFLGTLHGADGFSRNVVIKRVLPQHSENIEFVTMFRDEARITSQLFHGNIVQVVEFGVSDGLHYLVLEHVNGPSLSSTLQSLKRASRKLSLVESAHIASEVARALDYAHRKRGPDGAPLLIVHRDVTPSNILLSKEGEVKLADFGIARARARLSATAGDNTTLKGKLSYMAPETLTSGVVQPQSDLFALGAVLYEMLTGTRPFRGHTEADTVTKLLHSSPPAPSQLNPQVPAAIDELVARLIAKSPGGRPDRALAVAEALAQAVPTLGAAAETLADTLATLDEERNEDQPTVVSSTPSERALIVHESKTVRAVLRAKLQPRYEVSEASSAAEALACIRGDARPDVVLCQRALNDMSGLEVCRAVRADPSLYHVMFVLLTSEDTPALHAEAEECGARAVVTQSLSTGKLLALLHRGFDG